MAPLIPQSYSKPIHEQSASEAVIYARYSSHSQRDVSIEQQIRACRSFAEHHGISVVHIYEDHALTGTTDKRPGFQQMIQDAKKGTWNYVIVYTLDRFARDRYDSAVYKRQLKNHGIKVLSAMENISDDPTGILMESMLEGLAEYYSKELSRKITRGLSDNASKCMVNGSLPLGYVRGPDGRYAIQEAEAEVVREIFSRVKDEEPFQRIIDDLNARGILTKKGRLWTHSNLSRLLNNERYTGVYIFRDVRIPGGVPQIIPQELFDSVQHHLRHKPNSQHSKSPSLPQRRRRENGTYLLTGKLFCGNCKEPMIGVSGTSHTSALHFYYTCKGRRGGHSTCTKKSHRRDSIEQFVATALRNTMLTDRAIAALADAAVEYQHRNANHNELDSLKNQLADTNRSISNLVSAVEAGIFTASTQSRLLELEARKRELTRLVAAAKEQAESLLSREEIIATLEFFKHGNLADKNYQEALIDTFLVAAYVYDDRVKFVVNLGDRKEDLSIPFNIDDIDLSEVRINNSQLHQKRNTFCLLTKGVSFQLNPSLRTD